MSTSQTERIGIHKVALLVSQELSWVWREQPIADFGIDGLIEQCENGRPNGRLLAVQVKSGLGNVKVRSNDFTYYASNIHREYWLNYCIPVILILYDPANDNAYWVSLEEQNFKKTLKRWKLSIPKKQLFSKSAERRLTQLLEEEQNPSEIIGILDGSMKAETIFDHVEKLDNVSEATDSINRIVGIMDDTRLKLVSHNEKLKHHIENNLNDEDPQVKATIKSLASSLNLQSKRIDMEVGIFSETFSDTLYSLEITTIAYFNLTKNVEQLDKTHKSISQIPNGIKGALNGLDIIESSFQKYPKKYPPLKIAKDQFLSTCSLLREEFSSASKLCENLLRNIETWKNNVANSAQKS